MLYFRSVHEKNFLFRAYDIRGVAGRDLDGAWAERLGRACGALFRDGGFRVAAVGRDCRASSPGLCRALIRGLASGGVDMVLQGMVPTPCLYYAVRRLGLGAGIMVTASHSPASWNGFKIWMGDGVLNESGILDLRRRMAESGPSSGGSAGLASRFDILPLYVEEVVERLGPCPPFRVVLDGGNGAAGPVCLETLRRLGAEVIPLFCSPDGRFPHHPPDPAKEENMLALREAVLAHGADLGIGLDGDGDRIGVMDRKGRLLAGDELLAVYARDLLARVPGARVLADVKCSERLFRDILARGGEPEMCRTGHAPLKARLRESGALLAGELSGHICHAENWYGFDDATYCAGRLLGALGRLGEPLERLPGWPPAWITPERDIPCPDEKKFDVVRRALEWFRARRPVIDIDGVRVLYDGGWGLVRASNTSPSLTLRFEAVSPERLAFIRRDMEDRVRKWADEAG